MRRLLVGIIVLAFILRLVNLSSVPAGFTPDEASFGYDAYSLLETGKDQWGNTWPLAFKSFGDYKLPVYGYLTVPFVWAFGLNEFAVRLPNALLGSFAVLAVYLLIREDQKEKSKATALIAAFLLAISPWHVPMSRGAFEANLTTFFMPLGILFFLKAKTNSKYLYLSALAFGINLFTYHSARLITPILVAFLLLLYRKEIYLKKSIGAGLVFFTFLTIAVLSYLAGSGSRAGTSVIFNPTGGWTAVGNERFLSIIAGENPFIARVFNNKVIYVASTFTENYLSYFSDEFLFLNGPREATYGMVPGRGVLYLFELPLIALALWSIVKGKHTKFLWLVIFWILVSPIPASIAKGPGGAANRATVMLPAIHILSSMGAVTLYDLTKPKLKKSLFNFVALSVVLVSFVFFLEDYFIGQKITGAPSMVYGARDVITEVNTRNDDYDQIIISRKLSEPHIYVAFYTKMDPSIVQSESREWDFEAQGLDWVDQIPEYSMGKYYFKNIDMIADFNKENVLLVGKYHEFTEGTSLIRKIDYPNLAPAYLIVDPSK